jgi:hypothetical protein
MPPQDRRSERKQPTVKPWEQGETEPKPRPGAKELLTTKHTNYTKT